MGVYLLLIAVLIVLLIPAITVATQNDKIVGLEQSENQTINLDDSYYSNVTKINSTTGNVTIEIFYNKSVYDSNTTIIGDGNNLTISVNQRDFNVTNGNITTSRRFISYKFSPYLGWGTTQKLLVQNITIILISLTILLIFGMILSSIDIRDK